MNIVKPIRMERWKAPVLLASAGVVLAVMTGCQSVQVEETAIESSLPAAAAPQPDPVGTVYHVVRNGEKKASKKTAEQGSRHTFRDEGGCQWTEDFDRDPVFAPEVSWKECQSTGAIEISSKSGGMWPLEIGSSVSFKAHGTSSTNASWPADFTCEAVDAVRITVAAGTFDTYKVKCSTPWRAKTMYFAPSIGRVVKSIQYPKNGSSALRYESELVSVELPSS